MCRPGVPHATQLSLSRHWRERKGLVRSSSFLQPRLDSWSRGSLLPLCDLSNASTGVMYIDWRASWWICLLPVMSLICWTWTARVAASFSACCWSWWCTTIHCWCPVHCSCCFDISVSATKSWRLSSRLASAFEQFFVCSYGLSILFRFLMLLEVCRTVDGKRVLQVWFQWRLTLNGSRLSWLFLRI